jgi:flagellar hook-length control protein FliK
MTVTIPAAGLASPVEVRSAVASNTGQASPARSLAFGAVLAAAVEHGPAEAAEAADTQAPVAGTTPDTASVSAHAAVGDVLPVPTGTAAPGEAPAGEPAAGDSIQLAAAFGWPAHSSAALLAGSAHSRQPGPVLRSTNEPVESATPAVSVPSPTAENGPALPLAATVSADASGAEEPAPAGATADGGATPTGTLPSADTPALVDTPALATTLPSADALPLAAALPPATVPGIPVLRPAGIAGVRLPVTTQPVPPSMAGGAVGAAAVPAGASPAAGLSAALNGAEHPAAAAVPAGTADATATGPTAAAATAAAAAVVAPSGSADATPSATADATGQHPTGTTATAAAATTAAPTGPAPTAVVLPGFGLTGAPSAAPSGAGPALLPAHQPALPSAPLAGQLTAPLSSLGSARPGEHLMTVRVTPEDLGPVTVRAHISATEVRIDLVSPTDAGREALRAALSDLKRDLAATGLNANLHLSSGNQSDSGGREPGRNPFPDPVQPARPAPARTAGAPAPATLTAPTAVRGLDVIT